MINFNGQCVTDFRSVSNHFHLSGFEEQFSISIPIVDNQLVLWESFYFHLMAQLRQRRFTLPDHYTPDFFEDQWRQLQQQSGEPSQTLRISCFRSKAPSAEQLYGETSFYLENHVQTLLPDNVNRLTVDLYKDQSVVSHLDTQGGKKPQPITQIGQIFALENGWDASILLNQEMHLAYSSLGTLYLYFEDGTLKTPDVLSAGLSHPLSRAWEEWLATQNVTVEKASMAPFELQQAEGVALWDPERGFSVVEKYRKTTYKETALLEYYNAFKSHLSR